MATTRTTTVTHPDGTVSTRKSKTMTYAYAVQVTSDNHIAADWHRAQAAGLWAALTELSEIIASGALSRLGRKATGFNGLGERFYSSYVQGDYPPHLLPDHRKPVEWAE